MLTHDSTELTDPGVVPSLAHRWSHHTGGTHLKVVPCHWRATIGRDGLSTRLHADRWFEACLFVLVGRLWSPE